ncbi:GTP pyrophosphokinase [Stenotrophomonas sp. ATs4]|uniref:GTP pyrophosphokinase n=1 Tax=Stenotrophomonas sp. ATs4 TaxID=3402766 RepID=UPI003F72B73B
MSQDDMRNQYSDESSRLERLRVSAVAEIGELLESNGIALGVPIESRVKTWESIEDKVQRKDLTLGHVRELDDLVGIRMILLFRSDLDIVVKLLGEHFEVISSENTGERLGDSEFGYQSQHVIARISPEWLKVPSFSLLGDLKMEFQVRTLAQHIWAAVSHKLQYKNEGSVPPPLRRAINRASALLETVDLEFERVLSERKSYVESGLEVSEKNASLNVDSLAIVLAEELPEDNRIENERYAELLTNLVDLSVKTAADLRKLLKKHRAEMSRLDAELVKNKMAGQVQSGRNADRIAKGVFLSHVGLVRGALKAEFGADRVSEVMNAGRPATRGKRRVNSK